MTKYPTLLLVTVLFLASCSYFEVAELKSTSPNKTYTVLLKERQMKDYPNDFEVKFDVTKHDNPFLNDEVIDSYESDKYLNRNLRNSWQAENVLRLSFRDMNSMTDRISISNLSNKKISFLKIVANDNFLVFDLTPNSTTQILSFPQTDKFTDISWVSAFGRFENEKSVISSGMNFEIRGFNKTSSNYCISITDNEIKISSPDYKGYGLVGKNELKIEPDKSCN